ncbi:MAG: RIO1 family regulatory kinase/ATPase, partial [Anaeromyxobacteraceae bacterium]
MAEPLALLLDDGVIDEIYTRLKSGKEADIYLVRHAGEVVAAKVYKERNARNFKNNAAYKEGRRVRNTRTQRAMDKGSRFGQEASEEAWKAKESEALSRLHAAGVRVPKPVMFYEGVLLMETILDADGRPAPRLVEAAIPLEKAAEWYADVRSQAVKMLACDLVHGDLSPYNVLLAWNGPTVIDFPQVVGASHNSQAERFFERDLETIRRFFLQHDPGLSANAGDAGEIWRAFVRRELTPEFVPTGKHVEPARPRERQPGQPHERRPDRREPQGGRRQDQQPRQPLKQQPRAHTPG